jgi:hypothetical protein
VKPIEPRRLARTVARLVAFAGGLNRDHALDICDEQILA